jgi:hypothetical protein
LQASSASRQAAYAPARLIEPARLRPHSSMPPGAVKG